MKLLFLDIDGTLTDGKIYIGNHGECMKSFNVQDGYGIKNLLPQVDCIPIVITGRKSDIVESRCRELGIREIYQGISNKLDVMERICNQKGKVKNSAGVFPDTYYIGDDIPDLECMKVAHASAAPADAVPVIIKAVTFKCIRKGGEGAVREFIEWIISKEDKKQVYK